MRTERSGVDDQDRRRATATPGDATEESEPGPSLRDWIGLVVLLTGSFVVQVDFFIVNVALPSIQRDLSATLAETQLVALIYGGAFAIAVVTGGRLGDLFGRKRLFVIGLLAFGGASLLCGVAWSGWVLVVARVAQGFAAAIVLPQTLGSLHAMFSGRARERAFSIFGVQMGLAWVSGIALGGLLVSAGGDLGWRIIFLINIPLVVLALLGTVVTITESRRPDAATLDLAGMLAFATVAALLILPLILGREAGWPAWAFVGLGLVPVGAVALARIERRVLARGGWPLLSPELFRDRNFRLGLTVIVVFFLGPPGFFLLTTLYLQGVRGFSAGQLGLVLLPFGVVFVLTSYAVKRLKEWFGEAVIVLGVAVMVAGLILLAATIERAGAGITVLSLVPGTALLGLGQALVTTPLYELLLRHVPKRIAATASGVFTTVQLVAQSLSVAVLVIIFTAVAGEQMRAAAPDEATRLEAELRSGGMPAAEVSAALAAFDECVSAATPTLVSGEPVTCAGTGSWRAEVQDATDRTLSVAVRRGYALTLSFNLLVLVVSGLIMAAELGWFSRRRSWRVRDTRVPTSGRG